MLEGSGKVPWTASWESHHLILLFLNPKVTLVVASILVYGCRWLISLRLTMVTLRLVLVLAPQLLNLMGRVDTLHKRDIMVSRRMIERHLTGHRTCC
jgi:hypothetical protein